MDHSVIEATNGVRQTFQEGYSSPLGMILTDGNGNESFRACCFRQRWRFASIFAILGLVMIVVSIIMSVPVHGETEGQRYVAFFLFISGLFVIVLPIGTNIILSQLIRRRGAAQQEEAVRSTVTQMEFDAAAGPETEDHEEDDFKL